MPYDRPYPDGWRDLPDLTTAITAAALDIMDDGIEAATTLAESASAAAEAASGALSSKAPLLEGKNIVPSAAAWSGAIPNPVTSGKTYNEILLDANKTVTLPTVAEDGLISITVLFIQDATGGRTVTWPGGVTWVGGSPPVVTPNSGAATLIVLWTKGLSGGWMGDGPAASAAALRVEDEGGSPLPARSYIDFAGAGVTATDDSANDRTVVTIPGGSATFDKRWEPVDNALKAANMDPAVAAALGNGTLVASTTYVFRMKVKTGDVVTGALFEVGAAGTGTLAGFQSALFDNTGALVASTADVSTSFASGGPASLPFSATYTATYDGYVYLTLRAGTATTAMPKLLGSGTGNNINVGLTVGSAVAPSSSTAPRFATAAVAWTVPTAPSSLGNITSTNSLGIWAGLF